ncbi:adenine deaminase C-terminal domain-containing protein [Enterococcus sp. LJL90]
MKNRWSIDELRQQVALLDGQGSPNLVLKNATYLNVYLRRWNQGNLWIYQDRIIYVGEEMPEELTDVEIMDCTELFLVPGYIEPHIHPSQFYNPVSLAEYAAKLGTTMLINDNLFFLMTQPTKNLFAMMEAISQLPTTTFWWARLDSQTEFLPSDNLFNTEMILDWLDNEHVIQAGELTAWPRLLKGDDELLSWMLETKKRNKKIEGHFPGSSAKTLAKLKLLGADADHEAMTGAEVMARIQNGYMVTLRDSSIRPDLDVLLDDLLAAGVNEFSRFMLTTDGGHPYFYENGITDRLIKMVLAKGIPETHAYNMAAFNVASYYDIEDQYGSLATGRIANINFLQDKKNPTPVHVLAKGQWVKKSTETTTAYQNFNWAEFGFEPAKIDWDLTANDFDIETTVGIHVINNVITRPYEKNFSGTLSQAKLDADEALIVKLDKQGKWRVSTFIKGFVNSLGGMATTYSGTMDLLLIGKNQPDMTLAFERLKTIGGGLVLVDNGEIIFELPLELDGRMSLLPMEQLIQKDKELKKIMAAHGFAFADIGFALMFLAATHLPFIRITPTGIFDVKANQLLIPSIPR